MFLGIIDVALRNVRVRNDYVKVIEIRDVGNLDLVEF